MLHPEIAPAPAGKVRTAEYGTFPPSQMVKVTPLAKAPSRGDPSRMVNLEHRSRGYAIAGSCARWDEECWAVHFTLDGARHGQRFRTEDAARAHFNARTLSNGAPADGEG